LSLLGSNIFFSAIFLSLSFYDPLFVRKQLGTGWTVRGSNPVGGGARFSAPVQTDPGSHPDSYTMGTGSFLGAKGPGLGVDHPPHLVPRLKEE